MSVERPASGVERYGSAARAVFLSYAREDAPAARRIAEALRAHGVEVWFDENELRGGDVWDAKLRRQIRECALFMPVVSAQTQERGEGYFRLEWKLAVERTHLMAEGVPFLAPVVIDETSEANAIAPAEFLRAQWTRLPGALPSPDFVVQVKRLLDAPRKPVAGGHPASRSSGASAEGETVPLRRNRKAGPTRIAAAAVAVALIGLGASLATRKSERDGASAPAPSSLLPAPAAASDLSAAGLAKADAKSIAVLPFANMSDDKDANAFFADGIHEDILTNLALIRELRVVSRTSVMSYRGTTKKIGEIARELRVAYVLEGSVRRAGNRMRVTGQLIRAATDEHVWAKSYDRDLADIFAVQSELAQDIAGEMRATLSPQEKLLVERRPTESLAAYDLYLQARTSNAALSNQEALLSAAVALDPKFANAWAELASVHARIHFSNIEHSASRLARATEAIEKAVQLSRESPEVIRNLGNYHLYGFRDYVRATQQFERLAGLQPNNSDIYFALGETQQRQARWTDALANFRKATQLDPRNVRYSFALYQFLRGGRRWAEAIAEHRRLAALRGNPNRELFSIAVEHYRATGSRREVDEFFAGLPPEEAGSPATMALRVDWERQSGNYGEAIRILRSSTAPLPAGIWDIGFGAALTFMAVGDKEAARSLMQERVATEKARLQREPENTEILWRLGLAEAVVGHREEALRHAKRLTDLIPESFDAVAGAEAGNKLALIYAWAGEMDRAIAEAGRLLQTPFSVTCVRFMRHDPWWFPLRGDPRFEALLNEPKNNAPLF